MDPVTFRNPWRAYGDIEETIKDIQGQTWCDESGRQRAEPQHHQGLQAGIVRLGVKGAEINTAGVREGPKHHYHYGEGNRKNMPLLK